MAKLDKRFESKLLRALMQSQQGASAIIESIDTAHFKTPHLQWVFQTMKRLKKKHGELSVDMVEAECAQAVSTGSIKKQIALATEKFVGTLRKPVKNRSYFLGKAEDLAVDSEMRVWWEDTAKQMANTDGLLTRTTLEQMHKKVCGISAALSPNPIYDYFGQLDQRTHNRQNFKPNGVATGMFIDDLLVQRGLGRGNLGLVMADTGVGKTNLLVHFGSAALRANLNVLHISLEMCAETVSDRYDAKHARIPMGILSSKAKLAHKRIMALGPSLQKRLRIVAAPSGMLTIEKMRDLISSLESSAFYPDLILLDYADIMSLSTYMGGGRNTMLLSEALGKLYVDLRGLSQQCNAALWTATQVNRDGANDTLTLARVRSSGEKAHNADLVIGLTRTPEEKDVNNARLVIAKNRFGPTGDSKVIEYDPSIVHIAG